MAKLGGSNLTSNDILKLRPTILKAAKSVAYNWPGILDADDAEQMITLHLLERAGSLSKIVDMDRAAQYRAVVGIGHQIASQERADYDHFKGSYRYSVKEVKDVLNAGVLVEDVEGFREFVFGLIEALTSLTSRSPQYVAAILSRYADFETPQDKSGQNALSRGLEALTLEMNKSNKRQFATRDDGPGTRRVISNATAQRISSKEYDGDYDRTGANWEQGQATFRSFEDRRQ